MPWCDRSLRLFTRDRHELERPYLADERLRFAYLAYFLPVNAAKVQTLLGELPETEEGFQPLQTDAPVRVLDVGSGPGTASLAVLDWTQRASSRHRRIEVTAVDSVRAALDEAQHLWNGYCRTVFLTMHGFIAFMPIWNEMHG